MRRIGARRPRLFQAMKIASAFATSAGRLSSSISMVFSTVTR
jgi:hypothetical protein